MKAGGDKTAEPERKTESKNGRETENKNEKQIKRQPRPVETRAKTNIKNIFL